MKTAVMHLYFEDECPRIGCGWRHVSVKVGRKWVYFTYPPNGGTRVKVRKDVAEKIMGRRSYAELLGNVVAEAI